VIASFQAELAILEKRFRQRLEGNESRRAWEAREPQRQRPEGGALSIDKPPTNCCKCGNPSTTTDELLPGCKVFSRLQRFGPLAWVFLRQVYGKDFDFQSRAVYRASCDSCLKRASDWNNADNARKREAADQAPPGHAFCRSCLNTKKLVEFDLQTEGGTEYDTACRTCRIQISKKKQLLKDLSEKDPEWKICCSCHNWKYRSLFTWPMYHRDGTSTVDSHESCRDCGKLRRKQGQKRRHARANAYGREKLRKLHDQPGSNCNGGLCCLRPRAMNGFLRGLYPLSDFSCCIPCRTTAEGTDANGLLGECQDLSF
jgi:hypothetical protein